MAAVKLPIAVVWAVRAGSDLAVRYRWTAGGVAVDMGEWSARLQARLTPTSRAVLLDWNDDHITLSADGLVSVDAAGTETATWGWAECIADLDLTADDDRVVPFLRARITVTPGVIRD